jgi:hypothetical protein
MSEPRLSRRHRQAPDRSLNNSAFARVCAGADFGPLNVAAFGAYAREHAHCAGIVQRGGAGWIHSAGTRWRLVASLAASVALKTVWNKKIMRQFGTQTIMAGYLGFTRTRENDHETCDNSIGFCVRTLKHVRTCTDKPSIHKSSEVQVGL